MTSTYTPKHAGPVPDVSPIELAYFPRHANDILARLGALAFDMETLQGILRVPSHVREMGRA